MNKDFAFSLTLPNGWRLQSHRTQYGLFRRRGICARDPLTIPTARNLHLSACKTVSLQATQSLESNTSSSALLVVDHGSRRAAANEMLSDIVAMVRARSEIPVYMAHMELASPTISDGIDTCVQGGASHVIVLPFFLSPGRHTTADIPEIAATAAAKYPDVTYEVRPPIGTHPGVIDILLDRAGLL